ncbi:MAG TPA: hypothetical protein VLH56_19635 [Dissulfurispiraceae bacterium]|nr:hypothetical protein [Dissulfurispiraceae bacterium]
MYRGVIMDRETVVRHYLKERKTKAEALEDAKGGCLLSFEPNRGAFDAEEIKPKTKAKAKVKAKKLKVTVKDAAEAMEKGTVCLFWTCANCKHEHAVTVDISSVPSEETHYCVECEEANLVKSHFVMSEGGAGKTAVASESSIQKK